jgi:hypothetical protein
MAGTKEEENIMPIRKEPSEKDKSLLGSLPLELTEFLQELRAQIGRDDDDRAIWKNKMIAASNQRLGVKRRTDNPYPGAPNIPLPLTDKLIKKQIPNLILSIWAPKHICSVDIEPGVQDTPQLKEKAKKAEAAMNMILRNKMDLYNKLEQAAEYAKEKGHCVVRVLEDFKSRKVHKVVDLRDYADEQIEQLKALPIAQLEEFLYERYNLDPDDNEDGKVVKSIKDQLKSGEEVIEFDIEEVSSLPNIDVPLPTKIIVPSWVTDINKSPRITYEYFLTRYELENLMNKEIFIKKDLDEKDYAVQSDTSSDLIEHQKAIQEGVTDNTSEKDIYRIHEICCWWKEPGAEEASKWVFTFFADIMDAETALLQRIPFPFEFDGWNYEKYNNEQKDPRYYNSRGIPEQISAIQDMMERCINNQLIRDELNNTPAWEVLDTSKILDGHQKFIPGMMYPVGALGTEMRKLNEPIGVDLASDRMLNVLKAYAEEYLGSTDQLFRNATNAGGGKTLGEINLGVQQASGALNVEVIRWNEFWTKVFRKIFDIMRDRLGDSIYVDGQEVTKEDFNFPADVRCNGQLEVVDKQLSAQKAAVRMQMVPQWMQLGIADQEDLYNAATDFLEKDGVKNPDDFITNPLEIMQTKLAQMNQQLQQGSQQLQAMQQEMQNTQKSLAGAQEDSKKLLTETKGKMEAITKGGN